MKIKKQDIWAAALLIICLVCFFAGRSIGKSAGSTEMSAVVFRKQTDRDQRICQPYIFLYQYGGI